jgi:hypothetical protein
MIILMVIHQLDLEPIALLVDLLQSIDKLISKSLLTHLGNHVLITIGNSLNQRFISKAKAHINAILRILDKLGHLCELLSAGRGARRHQIIVIIANFVRERLDHF